jgi:hypothetical protein
VPDYWRPAVFGMAAGLLLLMRLPPVRRWLAAQLGRTAVRGRRTIKPPQIVAVDAAPAEIEVSRPAPYGPLAVVLWLFHIVSLGKRQGSANGRLRTGAPTTDASPSEVDGKP